MQRTSDKEGEAQLQRAPRRKRWRCAHSILQRKLRRLFQVVAPFDRERRSGERGGEGGEGGELILFTVTFCANPANDLTCPPSYIIINFYYNNATSKASRLHTNHARASSSRA